MSDYSRSLNLSGATNFRDLGGYAGRDGREVRWRKLFRSDHLGDLTPADIEVLRSLGLRRAVDLRGVAERHPPYTLDGVSVYSTPIEPMIVAALLTRMATGGPLTAPEAAELMRDSYRNYVRNHTESYRALFAHLLEDDTPLVIHCTAGKDRTGFGSALILTALGVEEPAIVEDYLLTNALWRVPPQPLAASPFTDDVRDVLISVEASCLAAALDAVRTDYGSVDAYLTDGVGLGPRERETLERRYLAA